MRCRICEAALAPFVSFGRMPIANGFLTEADFATEPLFELAAARCEACGMVQLLEQPAPEAMFHENYAFFTSTSRSMAQHFGRLAEGVMSGYVEGDRPFVVEIGCNDGVMLERLARAGVRHLGVEPAANVAAVAQSRGVQVLVAFFDEALAHGLLKDHGPADAVVATNVMCHVGALHPFVAGIKTLLKPRGVLVFEDPYLGDIVEKTAYDQIYDEHAFYFSVVPLSRMFAQHGLEIVNVEPQAVHGGSMRYVVAHKGARRVSPSVAAHRGREADLGLDRPATYEAFRHRVEQSRDALVVLLEQARGQGRRVVGYGATSKSTTVTNYCAITPRLVEYISDTTPIKQGKYSPGAHIPVRPYEDFKASYPDYALLFAWNHAEEIMANEQAYRAVGGQWIVYVPKVGVLA